MLEDRLSGSLLQLTKFSHFVYLLVESNNYRMLVLLLVIRILKYYPTLFTRFCYFCNPAMVKYQVYSLHNVNF